MQCQRQLQVVDVRALRRETTKGEDVVVVTYAAPRGCHRHLAHLEVGNLARDEHALDKDQLERHVRQVECASEVDEDLRTLGRLAADHLRVCLACLVVAATHHRRLGGLLRRCSQVIELRLERRVRQ